MTIDELMKKSNLYQVALLLGLKPTSVYGWKRKGKIPRLRVYQLRELKPEWFNEQGK